MIVKQLVSTQLVRSRCSLIWVASTLIVEGEAAPRSRRGQLGSQPKAQLGLIHWFFEYECVNTAIAHSCICPSGMIPPRLNRFSLCLSHYLVACNQSHKGICFSLQPSGYYNSTPIVSVWTLLCLQLSLAMTLPGAEQHEAESSLLAFIQMIMLQ